MFRSSVGLLGMAIAGLGIAALVCGLFEHSCVIASILGREAAFPDTLPGAALLAVGLVVGFRARPKSGGDDIAKLYQERMDALGKLPPNPAVKRRDRNNGVT